MSFESNFPIFDQSAHEVCERLERQLQRERKIRLKSEAIAERGLRDTYLANQRFELLCNIANAANLSTDPIEILRYAIAEILRAYDWAFANVLLGRGSQGDMRLEGCGIWHAQEPDKMFGFAELSNNLVAWPCATTPGKLLIDKTSVWATDMQSNAGSGRHNEAARCHLRSSFSVPVLQGDKLVAVMEFFDRSQVKPDPQLLITLDQIGVQIGRVFKRKRNEERLVKNALYDSLTELPNRAQFNSSIEDVFALGVMTGSPSPISVIYIDLDGFKLVNDALGHQAGDQLLIEMTSRLRQIVDFYSTTPFDQAPDNVTIARIGGDEFTVLVEGCYHIEISTEIAEEIHECLKLEHMIDAHEVRCSASLGIAHNDGSYATAADLIRDADLAMYEAKDRGTAETVIFDQAMRSTALEKIDLQAELREALVEGHFALHYQPIVQIADGMLIGFEALARWQRGNELVMPDSFLPAIQDAGMMNAFGSWVLREACQTAAAWRGTCPQGKPFYISVNVALNQLLQPNFASQVQGIICAANIDPGSLVIEVTEQAALTNNELTVRALEELQALGVRISLDDFGTGYSSFNHLQSMPFNTIKIDRSFVADLDSKINWSIVDAVLSIANASNVDVIAEGIENEEQAERLTQRGCSYGQGNLYGRAVAASEAHKILECQSAI